MNQTSREYDLEERTARFDEPVVKLHHFFIENLLSRFAGSGEARKIGNWKLKIGIIALLFFIWCDYASAFTITTPTKNKVGLVGHWTFDGKDMITGTVRDVSGNNNHGSMVNMATATARANGKLGQGLKFFGGTTERVVIASDPVGTGDMSASAWIYLKSYGTNERGYIFSSGPATQPRYFRARGSPYKNIEFTNDNNTTMATSLTNSIEIGRWYFVTVTNTSAGLANIYINGELNGSANQSAGTPQSGGTRLVYIGECLAQGTDSSFDGIIDDVRVYNRILSAQEILQIYKMGEGTKVASTPKPPTSSGCTTGITCGLVGHWTFDGKDMITGTVRDVSGNNNHGSMVNMATATARVSGKLGQALKFDGSNDRVDVGTTASLNITGALTISAWVNTAVSNIHDVIFVKGDVASTPANEQYHLSFASAKTPRISISNGTTRLISNTVTGAVPDGRWNHVVGTYNGTDTTALYINGIQVDTDTTASFGPINSISAVPTIGSYEGGAAPSAFLVGSLDDVRVYNRALSASEILALYKMGEGTKVASTPKPPTSSGCTTGITCGLVGHWTFDGKDMITGTVRDVSGNNNHGSMVNMATATARVPGKLGQALSFDGVDDYINAGTGANITSAVTVSAWVKASASAANDFVSGRGNRFNTGTASTRQYLLDYSANQRPRFAVSNGVSTLPATALTDVAPDGQWYNFVGTYNGTDTVIIYVNGVFVNSAFSEGYGNLNSAATGLGIGQAQSGGSVNYFKGLIDDVRIYNRALSAQEIQQLYNMGR